MSTVSVQAVQMTSEELSKSIYDGAIAAGADDYSANRWASIGSNVYDKYPFENPQSLISKAIARAVAYRKADKPEANNG